MPELPPHLMVQRVLGEGGTSIVFEALHTRLRVQVAVKVLIHCDPHDIEAHERLLREAELYARLGAAGVPRVYDVDRLADGTPYLVMEQIQGRTLADIVAHGPLCVELACAILREALETMITVHEGGVVHRDIKPANIIVQDDEHTGEQRVRIVDFGIAKNALSLAPSDALTQQGMMIGTPYYMAPEQIKGIPLDARADLYALGVVLYEMLAGIVPYDGATLGDVIAASLRDTPASIATLRPDVSPQLAAFVERAMARERQDRFASAYDMLCALNDALCGVDAAPQADAERASGECERAPALEVVEMHEAAEPHEAEVFAESPRTLIVLPDEDDGATEALAEPDEIVTHSGTFPRVRMLTGALAASLALALWPTRISDASVEHTSSLLHNLSGVTAQAGATSARAHVEPLPVVSTLAPAERPSDHVENLLISASFSNDRKVEDEPRVEDKEEHRTRARRHGHEVHARELRTMTRELPAATPAERFAPALRVVPVPAMTLNELPQNPYN